MTTLLWLTPIVWPFLAALVVLGTSRGRAVVLASGPLPALALAVLGPPAAAPTLSWVLLDLRLGLDPAARVLLLTTALVWLGAGWAARHAIGRHGGAAALWLVTLGGNIGLVLAADVVSLYALYGVMTLAAYGLVVLERTPTALRAGRVYLVMALLGEVLLLVGLVLGAGAAGGTDTDQVAAALAEAPNAPLIIALLAAGFGVKAGVVPLHVWLPLAHPAAPVPASAALSGAMIKAGLVGWISLLPLGVASAPGWSATFIVVGLVTALWGAAIGVLQDRPKVVLAYSSISQMGLITVVVGLALASPAAAPAGIAAAVTYALHHGVAKGALFLGVGVRSTWPGTRGRRAVLVGTAVAGLALAGAPFSSGWVAKAAIKSAVSAADLAWTPTLSRLLSVAAVGTTLLLARLLVLLARPTAGEQPTAGTRERSGDVPARWGRRRSAPASGGGHGLPDRAMLAGWLVLLGATLVATWLVPVRWLPEVALPKTSGAALWDATWPILVGAAVTGVALRLARRAGRAPRTSPIVPAGDLLVVAAIAAPALSRMAAGLVVATVRVRDRLDAVLGRIEAVLRPGEGFARLDVLLRRWQVAGALFLVLGAALIVALSG